MGSNWTRPAQTGVDRLKPDQTGLNETRLAKIWFDRLKLDSNVYRTAQTGLDWLKQDQTGSNRIKTYQTGS